MTPEEARTLVASMTEDERAVLEDMARLEDADRAAHPLRYARLWDNPQPKTSQVRPLRESVGADAIGLFGGNGSGKTEAGAQLCAACALGRNHPDARAWCETNGIPLEMLPPYPGRILASSLTSNESRRVQREKMRKYLPKETRWLNENGNGEAEARVPGGGVIVFKSNDQGRRAYQADEFDIAWLDEEHDEDVVSETFMRLDRRPWKGGYLIASMTPLKGLTHMYRDFVEKPQPGYKAWWIFGEDNPYADQEARRRKLGRYGTHERTARDRGEFTALEGRVYADWRRDLHVQNFEARPAWKRFLAADWGTTVPTSIGLFYYDEARDVVYLRRMVYRTELTVQERAGAILALEAGAYHADMTRDELLEWAKAEVRGPESDVRWGDPEDASTMQTLRRDFDIAITSAKKDVKWGINVVAARLRPDVLGEPHFVVHPDCVDFIREVEGYVWAEGKDAPRKENDHAMDMARYGLGGISRAYGLAPDVEQAA